MESPVLFLLGLPHLRSAVPLGRLRLPWLPGPEFCWVDPAEFVLLLIGRMNLNGPTSINLHPRTFELQPSSPSRALLSALSLSRAHFVY